MPPETLHILCAGACQSLLNQIRPRLAAVPIQVEFGPVGRLSDLLRSGSAADVLLTSRRALGALVGEGYVDAASIQTVGRVPTSIAARAGAPGAALVAATQDPGRFADALLSIDHLYLPDTRRATAGIHMRQVFEALGVAEAVTPRLHELPNGAAAIARMVEDGFTSVAGFAQRTEIMTTAGAVLVGNLPTGFELITEYCGALLRKPARHPRAQALLDLLGQPGEPGQRHPLGFLEPEEPF